MKKVKQFLCLVMAVLLSVSCTDNTKMQNLLENIPENTDFVFVGSVKTVLESAGGKIENSKIVLPNYISNEMKEGDAEKFDEANNFLKDAGIDIEACAVMMSFRNFSPILVFALEDQQKFVDVLKQKGYQKDSDKGDAVFYMKPSESSYGSPNYVALNGSFAYVIMENYLRSDFNAISYLERVIEDAAEANYADTPSGEYILGTNGGGLAILFAILSKGKNRNMSGSAVTGTATGIGGLILNILLIVMVWYMYTNVPDVHNQANEMFEQRYGVSIDEFFEDMNNIDMP